jgi:nucleotide-binding universal stress UspA family protein
MEAVKRILACVDFSDTTASVTAAATTLAKALDAEVTLLFVAPLEMGMVMADAAPQPLVIPTAVDMQEYRQRLQDQVSALQAAGVRARGVCLQGTVVPVVHEQAKAIGAQMIILGSHGHGRMYHLLVGSVTQGVLRKAPAPVLVVPSPQSA